MAPKIIFDKITFFLKKNPHLLLVFFVFLMASLYHYYIIPSEALKGDKSPKEKVQTEQPDLDAKHQEKIYPHIFQSQAGDVFRVGIFVVTKNSEDIEIFAKSGLHEVLKIGEWRFDPSENGEYKELLFLSQKRYEDVIVRLKKNEDREVALLERNKDMTNKRWDDSAVYIRSFFVSRVEANNAMELRNIIPTTFGISSMKRDILLSQKHENNGVDAQNSRGDFVEWIFQSSGDLLNALEFSGKIIGSGRQEYVFSLMRYFPDKKEKEGELLHTGSFILDSLDDLLESTGNYRMLFPVPLRQGEQYKVILTRVPSKNQDNFFTLGSLETNPEAEVSVGDLALIVGERLREKNGTTFLDGAKLEDLGKNLLYSFSLQGTSVDYANIFSAKGNIRYDSKKHLVIGDQKNREYLIYRFDFPRPFDQFVLEATQEGNDEKEIKLEYSFDDAFWREIVFTQDAGDAQRFLLTLDGDGKSRTVYVRASYAGAEKKSGFFALKILNVNASIKKTQ